MAKTLRGRYFSQSNVLNATRGYRASFGWQSILHGRNLLRTGLRYIVGDGSMIQTWKYNVKSGYWLGTHLPNPDPAILPPGDPQLKSQIWNLNTPPKIKHFLWRMLSRVLAVSTELERRHIVTDSYCRRCVTMRETTDHLFFTCSHACQIWRASSIPLPCLSNPQVPYETKIKEIFEFHKNAGKDTLQGQLPLLILWRIWRSRNKLVFQSRQNGWWRDLRDASHDAEEWITHGLNNQSSTTSMTSAPSCPHQRRWKKPRPGWIKCNYDGSFVNQNNGATTAYIIRDNSGVYKGAAQATGVNVTSAFEAECQSLILAMQQLWVKGYIRIIFEGDCKLLVNVLNGSTTKFDAINWIQEIQDWGKKFEAIEYSWAHRSTNQPADILAKNQRNALSSYLVHFYIPVCISNALFLDYIGSA
ncbi:uncharacterized protein LOC110224440 [Arabidopsis lyrata subsp. lyrata]|uniref:uncharacterized protein LOC110224440 n=1 Tax=Arabidopsis lyrata subsp. lyrata TaxID=81972 RepID=UPI000A29B12F|nr:uncharacterized protein LOC110224440 [Arabidopsis lyrata subsp. lyrata]|eukprot:XP_020866161.1 uncharacterized protein LOC110224440 [Arabidopsis lyrata subsp. lyrata]